MPRSTIPLSLLLLGASVTGALGQDVEMLGERYGTPVPDGYYRSMRADPAAFQFRRGWSNRTLDFAAFQARAGGSSGPALTLGPRSGPVVGTFEIPVLLGMYSNSGGTPPFPRDTLEQVYFGPGTGTITDYYTVISSDSVTLLGDVRDWVQTARPDTAYSVGESGLVGGPLGGGGAGNFVYEVAGLQGALDWGRYDNDGPDGVPNSGDDDGIVDVLAVIHPTRGGECGGSGAEDRIWSHRWSLSAAVGTRFVTSTPSAGGGFIEIDDYTIQPSIACSGGGVSEIGVFTHELGHAFGLPDLYDTDTSNGRHSGTGIWDLMSSGSWGCNNNNPASPCHMGAWSKSMLGWVDVITLAPDTDHGTLTLPPVETSGMVYRIDATDGSGEYFLIENRQRIGYDQNLFHEGLLIWRIDPDWIAARWPSNRVNAEDHLGVALIQADGRDDLGNGIGRGDQFDPYPGGAGNSAFHTATIPSSISSEGGVSAVTLVDIQESADDVTLRAVTGLTTVMVSATGASGPNGLFTVDGVQVDPPATTFSSAPFVPHTIEAVAGESVAPGERRPFVDWQDDPAAPRVRSIVTPLADVSYVAQYGGSQYELALTTTGGVNGVEPATFTSQPSSPDLWFDAGTSVTLQAVPTMGFEFLGWTGALTGQPNPASLTMSAPTSAGADFNLVYAVTETTVQIPSATDLDLQLEVVNGTAPVSWSIVGGGLPIGLTLSQFGQITGAAVELGTFPVTFQAVDAIGLPATGVVTLELLSPDIPIEQLTSPFLLTGPSLSDAQLNFLNRQGNADISYDLGDLRAWLQSNPQLPLAADGSGEVYRRTIVVGVVADEVDPSGGDR